MAIDPKLVTLAGLLQGRLFRIPEYQRAYSWTERQRTAMFEDIEQLAERKPDHQHFMATVVVLERARRTIIADEFAVVDVVDGQQRITTLVLLLRALERALDGATPGHTKLRAQLNDLLVKDDSLSLLLLQTNHDTSHVFVDYVRNGAAPRAEWTPVTLADRALRDAITECETWVAKHGIPRLLALAATLLNRLTFIVHTLADEATVYTVFEVLNSRGLPVAWIDRLKSMMMAVAFEAGDAGREHVAELHTAWKEVYLALGLRQGMSDEALRFAAVLLTGGLTRGRLQSAEDAALEVREWCGGDTKKAIEASRWLGKVVGAMNELYDRSDLAPLVGISQARFVGVAIGLSPLSADDRKRCLDRWERTVFRVFGIACKDARTLSGQLIRLGQGIHAGTVDADTACADLTAMAKDKSYGTIRDSLEDENCYWDWKEYLRFLLFRYEQHLAEQEGTTVDDGTWVAIWNARPDDTIEHVIPQADADADGFTADKLYVHRLGNLVLLPPGVNSKLGKKAFAEKRLTYQKSGLCHVREVGHEDRWKKKQIAGREERIIEWVEQEYGP